MSKFLSWLPTIFSAITWLIGQWQAAQANVMQAAGAFSSTEAATDSISFWSNVESGGLVATILSLGIPWLVKFIGGRLKGIKPGYVAAIDRGAIETLIQTRVGRPDDVPHIEALIRSAQKIEFDDTVAPLRAAVKGSAVALEVK